MYKNNMKIKIQGKTTSFNILSDVQLFPDFSLPEFNPLFPEDLPLHLTYEIITKNNFSYVNEYFLFKNYKKKISGNKLFYTKNDIEISFEVTKIKNILLHDIYSDSINTREFMVFINFLNIKLYEFTDSVIKNKKEHIYKIIENNFYI